MKASHRKDVIIARLIFAAICLFLIALIATIVITVTSKGGKKKEQDKVQQNAVSESETDSAGDSDTEIGAIYLPQQTTEGTEKTYVTTTSSVNMREKPDKNAIKTFFLPATKTAGLLNNFFTYTIIKAFYSFYSGFAHAFYRLELFTALENFVCISKVI